MEKKQLKNPPKLALKILLWLCKEELVEEIEGDLTEVFYSRVESGKRLSANLFFTIGVLSFLKPSVLKFIKPKVNTMLYFSYLKIARRSLFKKKSYGFINIIGLAIGLASALFMGQYVLNQLSYDKHFSDADKIYRITTIMHMDNNDLRAAVTPIPLGDLIKSQIPEISKSASFFFFKGISFELENQKYQEPNAFMVANNILDVFDFEILVGEGNPFEHPNTIIISQSKALDYFGSLDVLGKTVEADHYGKLTIRGVFRDSPNASHFKPNMLVNAMADQFIGNDSWGDINAYTYIKVEGDPNIVEAKLKDLVSQYMAKTWETNFNGSGELLLQPLTAIHLNSNLDFEIESNGKLSHVHSMIALGIFILIVVGINYINMTTAKATTRIKEIGIRKVMGSVKGMIRTQFIIESLLITTLAAILALVTYTLLLPYFNNLIGIEFILKDLINQFSVFGFLSVIIIIGIIGAWYPAGFVSKFKSADIFKSNFKFSGSKLSVSKMLNAIQFGVALVMIIITMIVYKQIDFMKYYELGYDKESIIKVSMNERMDNALVKRIKNELLSTPKIENVTVVKQAPGESITSDGLHFEMPEGGFDVIKTNFNTADESFLATLNIPLLAGRNFDLQSDEMARAVLVNETLVKQLGYKSNESILDKQVKLPLGDEFYAKIVGVMKDVHLQSLHKSIAPLIIVNFPHLSSTFLISVSQPSTSQAIASIDDIIIEEANSTSFDISMLDQSFWAQYKAEESRSKLMTIFSVLTILMAFVGLFGLVSYSVEEKVNEMTIRKIFGATFSDIAGIYFKTFAWVFAIAIAVGIPFAYYLGNLWLNDYAYRIEMPFQTFVFASLFLVASTSLIIVFKSRQSYRLNPVEKLRDD